MNRNRAMHSLARRIIGLYAIVAAVCVLNCQAAPSVRATNSCSLVGEWSVWSCSATCNGELTRTPWQMHQGMEVTDADPNGFVKNEAACQKQAVHGAICEYDSSLGIPAANDTLWSSAPDSDKIGMSMPSRLCNAPVTCWAYLDFTYFQTFVAVPNNYQLNEFSIKFSGMDDGSRVSVFNSKYPNGVVVDGSYVFLRGTGTANLIKYIQAGETNRVVVTQVDDCCRENNLQSALVSFNGDLVAASKCQMTSSIVTGLKNRTRAMNGQTSCGASTQYDSCFIDTCPVCCVVSDWSEWSCQPKADCTRSNAKVTGSLVRGRSVMLPPKNGGAPCPALSEDTGSSCTYVCPALKQDCLMTDWTEWICDASSNCAAGVRHSVGKAMRTRNITSSAANGGVECGSTTDSKSCSTEFCPVDCVMSSWSEWTCNALSNCLPGNETADGVNRRTRTVQVQAENGGKSCGPLDESKPCSVNSCPVDCINGPWSDWKCNALSQCQPGMVNATGATRRSRIISVYPKNGGVDCGALEETKHCFTDNCPIDCQFGSWSDWTCDAHSYCTANNKTAEGEERRSRNVEVQTQNGGASCERSFEQVRSCVVHDCPIDCVLSPWAGWSPCNATCVPGQTDGVQIRSRDITQDAINGGIACDDSPLEETRDCSINALECVQVVSTNVLPRVESTSNTILSTMEVPATTTSTTATFSETISTTESATETPTTSTTTTSMTETPSITDTQLTTTPSTLETLTTTTETESSTSVTEKGTISTAATTFIHTEGSSSSTELPSTTSSELSTAETTTTNVPLSSVQSSISNVATSSTSTSGSNSSPTPITTTTHANQATNSNSKSSTIKSNGSQVHFSTAVSSTTTLTQVSATTSPSASPSPPANNANDTSNKKNVVIGVSVAAGAAALAATIFAALYAYRKLNPDQLTGENSNPLLGVTNHSVNPLYATNRTNMSNPLFDTPSAGDF